MSDLSIEFLDPSAADDTGLVETIVGIMNRAYATAEKALWNREVGRTTVEEATDWVVKGEVAVARHGGVVVGAVCARMHDPSTGWFGALSVDPEHQNRGIAGALVRFVESTARRSGAREIEIEVLVPTQPEPHSDRLLSWYASIGYVEINRVRLADFDERAVDDALLDIDVAVMRKPLT
jgi:GNAT superfamily N-acetyltransferase